MKNPNEKNKNDFFKFESGDVDFPFYKDKDINKRKWFLLVIFGSFFLINPFYIEYFGEFINFLVTFLFFGYFSNWNYRTIFKKIEKKDIKLILIILVLSLVYAIAMSNLIDILGIVVGGYSASDLPLSLWVGLPFGLLSEEFFKIFLFLAILAFSYTISKNRKISIVISAIVTCICFGLIHYLTYLNIISVLLIQGGGTAFDIFAYVKTKNIWVTYIIHLLYDIIIFTLVLFGF